jgi:hypothetical protein
MLTRSIKAPARCNHPRTERIAEIRPEHCFVTPCHGGRRHIID